MEEASHNSVYSVSVSKFDLNRDGFKKKVAVVGSGCAGLSCAYQLSKEKLATVHLFEKNDKLGGHANSIMVDGKLIDTGFMVYNKINYPNLLGLFEELNVEGIPTEMGFSVSMDDGSFEWCADSVSGLLATPSNIINPSFLLMFGDIVRFNKKALELLRLPSHHIDKHMTTGDFLKKYKFSDAFSKYYLIPMTAAIWSSSSQGILNFPIMYLLMFLNNHLLLQTSDNIKWMTPKNRSEEYVTKIRDILGERVKLSTKIVSLRRENNQVTLIDDKNNEYVYDQVVFACHPDEALAILGNNATDEERKVLGSFEYSSNDVYVHSDINLMPKARAAWTSWNYLGASNKNDDNAVFVTYWINKLQSIEHDKEILVSLNPTTLPASEKTYCKIVYAHPQYSVSAIEGQRMMPSLQGMNNTYFAGAYLGYGFHEDGIRSGLEVAITMGSNANHAKWIQQNGIGNMIPASNFQKTMMKVASSFSIGGYFNRFMEILSQQFFFFFLRRGIHTGVLHFLLPDGTKRSFRGKKRHETDEVTIIIYSYRFFSRVVFEYELGLCLSYVAGEWTVAETSSNYDGITKLLLLLLDNTYQSNKKNYAKVLTVTHLLTHSPNHLLTHSLKSTSLSLINIPTAWIGGLINGLIYSFTLDNSVANSRKHIHAHYDLSNDLFHTFLDTKHYMYSCGIFEKLNSTTNHDLTRRPDYLTSKDVYFAGTLEESQTRKIDALLSRLLPIDSSTKLLDIGFGWGGISIRAASLYGCKVHGITLSIEQLKYAEVKVKELKLDHLITFELIDYRAFTKQSKVQFDRIVSCEMIEAVGHKYYPNFFQCIDDLLVDDGIFVMQAITMPDSRYASYVNQADFINTVIFPGGLCPSISALLNAATTSSSLHLENSTNYNLSYAETLRQWRYRFNDALPRVVSLGFDDEFVRLWNLYMCYCEAGFQRNILGLHILTFVRPKNCNMKNSLM